MVAARVTRILQSFGQSKNVGYPKNVAVGMMIRHQILGILGVNPHKQCPNKLDLHSTNLGKIGWCEDETCSTDDYVGYAQKGIPWTPENCEFASDMYIVSLNAGVDF